MNQNFFFFFFFFGTGLIAIECLCIYFWSSIFPAAHVQGHSNRAVTHKCARAFIMTPQVSNEVEAAAGASGAAGLGGRQSGRHHL